MYLVTYVDRVNVSTAASAFGPEFKLSNTQIGFVFSAFAYPYLILQILGGWLGDKLGPRRTLTICSFIWSAATVTCGFATGFVTLVVARIFLGIGEGAAFPTATRAMSNWVEPNKRGFAQGITHAFARLGNALAPPLISWLMITTNWRVSFILTGALSFIWTMVWFWYFRDDPRKHRGITPDETDRLTIYTEAKGMPKVPWRKLLPPMVPVTIVYFCYGWVLWLFLSWLPIYFIHRQHMDLKKSSIFAGGIFLAGVAGDWLGGEVTDHLSKKSGGLKRARSGMVGLCLLLTGLSLLPIYLLSNLGATGVALCLTAGFFFNEMSIGPMWCIPMDIAPKYAGTASGIMNSGSAFAAIVSPVVAGYMIDRTGNWDLPFIFSIGLMMAGALLSFTMQPQKKMV